MLIFFISQEYAYALILMYSSSMHSKYTEISQITFRIILNSYIVRNCFVRNKCGEEKVIAKRKRMSPPLPFSSKVSKSSILGLSSLLSQSRDDISILQIISQLWSNAQYHP